MTPQEALREVSSHYRTRRDGEWCAAMGCCEPIDTLDDHAPDCPVTVVREALKQGEKDQEELARMKEALQPWKGLSDEPDHEYQCKECGDPVRRDMIVMGEGVFCSYLCMVADKQRIKAELARLKEVAPSVLKAVWFAMDQLSGTKRGDACMDDWQDAVGVMESIIEGDASDGQK